MQQKLEDEDAVGGHQRTNRGKSIQWRRIGIGKSVSAAQAKRLEEELNEGDREILSESGKVKGVLYGRLQEIVEATIQTSKS